ncbi:tetratricopeptide repeat protein [Streptomyces sp. NPDC059991]|uniref:tetratricopeptide repeat protein n=1 Tax=Streptomyces sp. NPDC059991 TaxID=3347028 RepID=UPI00367868D1
MSSGRWTTSTGRSRSAPPSAVPAGPAAPDLDPTYSWALSQRGRAHCAVGRYDQAVADFTAALDLDPQ